MFATALTLGDVEPYQQIEKYSCGAATLKAVMQHWGEHVPEKTLIREIGIDPETGSTAMQVASAARRRGYLAQVRQFRSIDELATYTNRDVPVIVAMRSFTRPNQGHFVVATHVGAHVETMDPNVRGNRRTLSRREMDSRWRFRGRVGVIVVPKHKRNVLGQAEPKKLEARHVFTLVTVGAFVVASVVGAGVAIYQRRRAAH